MLPEERARIKIDKHLINAGWDVVSRYEYIPNSALAVKEALMQGNTESDYLLFVEDKAIAVVEAKKESDPLGKEVEKQAEKYAVHSQSWYGLWFESLIPLVYMANGNKIYYKNMLIPDSEYEELTEMHSPKKMLQIINRVSEYGALPRLEKRGLRDCRYDAEIEFEKSFKAGNKLKEVTPNADTKECYYIVDAVGVTEHEKYMPHPIATSGGGKRTLSLEHLSHNEVSDENLMLLRDYCATINRRYENNALFGRHLDYFITTYGFAPRTVANKINNAFSEGIMVEYISPSHDNSMRMKLIYRLISNIPARKKLLEMQRGYYAITNDEDEVIYAGFSKESAKAYIDNFEKYLNENRDNIEALRILYNSEDIVITHTMLVELRDRLLAENKQYGLGPDGQREFVFDGNITDISGIIFSGRTIGQVKYKYLTTKTDDYMWLEKEIENELKRFREKDKAYIPENYLFYTNIVLTPIKDTGVKDKINKYLKDNNDIIPNFYVRGYDEICAMLDNNRDVAICYSSHILSGDILVQYLESQNNNYMEVLAKYLARELEEDMCTQMEQAGSVTEKKVSIEKVCIDIDVKELTGRKTFIAFM